MNKYFFVSLENYYNHRSISPSSKNFEDDNLVEIFFESSFLPESLEIINSHGIPFIFPDKSPDKFDNILCNGQKIDIKEGIFSHIHILGGCVWGEYTENIKVKYSDGYNEDVMLSLFDFSAKELNNINSVLSNRYMHQRTNCKTTLPTKFYANNNIIFHFTQNKIPIINNKPINAVLLPENPFMHIYALTMEY